MAVKTRRQYEAELKSSPPIIDKKPIDQPLKVDTISMTDINGKRYELKNETIETHIYLHPDNIQEGVYVVNGRELQLVNGCLSVNNSIDKEALIKSGFTLIGKKD